jgi:hypothetical protein
MVDERNERRVLNQLIEACETVESQCAAIRQSHARLDALVTA